MTTRSRRRWHPGQTLLCKVLLRQTLLCALLCAGSSTLVAQSVAVLRAQSHATENAAPLTLHIERTALGQTSIAPWPASHIDWMLVRAAGEQLNLHQPAADHSAHGDGRDDGDGDGDAGEDHQGTVCTVEPIASGMHMIAIDLAPRLEQIPSSSLREFLATRVGEGTLPGGWREALPEGTVTVRRVESSKLLVRVGAGEHPSAGSATTQGKTGQQVEIRLQADPTLVPVAHDLPVKVYLPAVTAGATRVLATHGTSGATRSFRTDGGGRGAFTLGRQGPWLFEVHFARPLPDEDDADWEIFSATLSFAVPLGAEPLGADRGEVDR